jgi:UDP-N-acetylmuramate dehydrogenase
MKILQNHSLKDNNTFLLNVHTNYFAAPNNIADIIEIIDTEIFHKNPFFIIGEGSNLLFTNNFGGIIIKPMILGINIVEESTDYIIVKVGSGENWDTFVEWCVNNGYWGVENLSLIPGSAGSAPIQNIGAYGVEVKDIITKVEGLYIPDKTQWELTNKECEFGYRSSIFKTSLKNKFIVSSVSFKLSKTPNPTLNYGLLKEKLEQTENIDLRNIRNTVISIRNSKLPEVNKIGSAGSFFKNPIVSVNEFDQLKSQFKDIPGYSGQESSMKISAGWLIEQCGWKGKREGDIGIYPKHALIIVNYGNATGKEIFDFSERISQSVNMKFGIQLEREVLVI